MLGRLTKARGGQEPIRKLAVIVTYAMVINVFFVLLEMFTALYSNIPEHAEPLRYMFVGLDGHTRLVPWMWTSMALAAASLILLLVPRYRKNEKLLAPACGMVFLSLWIDKGLGLIVAGFVPTPLGVVTEYAPSLPEVLISLAIWAVGFLMHGTFDQLYPNIHDHHGLADQVAWQNLNSVRAGVRVTLRKNCMLAGAYNDWWLANAADGFYNASGTIVARDPKGLSGTHIGREYDAQISHRLSRHLELGAGLGYIRSGEFLMRTNHARAYTYPYVMLNYNVF